MSGLSCVRCGEHLEPVTDSFAYKCPRCGLVKSAEEAHLDTGGEA